MKKIILSILIVFIILITINNYSLATTGTINASAVRIREKASTDSEILTVVYKNDEVEILEEDGEWTKIKYKDKTGYAKSEFIKKTASTTSTNTNTNQNTTNTVSTNTTIENQNTQTNNSVSTEPINLSVGENRTLQNSIKLRIIPNFSGSEKLEISAGTNIFISAQFGNWYKITDGGNLSGWITTSKFNFFENQNTVPEVVEEPKAEDPVVEEKPSETKPEETATETPEVTQPEKTDETEPEKTVEEKPKGTDNQATTDNTTKTGIINVETARVRKSASTNSNVIDYLDEDDEVTIISEENEFYKISTNTIKEGYVSKSLVTEKKVSSRSLTETRDNSVNDEQPAEETNEVSTNATTSAFTGEEIVEFAKQYLGYPYVLGCSTPESGFDCSGFTRYVFGHFGYTLGRVAADQTSVGDVVERENLQIGDLILFYDDAKTKIGHTGIYIGDGNFIHSANPQRGVVTDNLNTNSYYDTRFVTARRIVI